ncbi:MAG: exodeoxyribonuclease III [Elusimicrobiota bacterium]|jgi:exodeoxyribonuclease-3|nr:exodeoxyribonuclease III [Elusimicrobiota bacterium]
MTKKFLSWNVNGLRAIEKKGFRDWLVKTSPDIIGLQETKAWPEQIPPALQNIEGYYGYFSKPERKGYSGVGIYCKEKPREISYNLGIEEFDREGRFILLTYPKFYFITCYFPNGGQGEERVEYKLRYYDAFLRLCKKLSKEKLLIACGDVNTAHKEIDLEHPKQNENNTGFLPSERAWLDRFFSEGLVDAFRLLHRDESKQYTWWDYKTAARERNVGWRIDYFMLDERAAQKLKAAYILSGVLGSDHAPIGVNIGL